MLRATNINITVLGQPVQVNGSLQKLVLLGLAAAGIGIVLLALFLPALRRPDGWPLYEAWVLTIVGASLVFMVAAYGSKWHAFAMASALALVGQATALGLMNAPSYNIVQHYFDWTTILGSNKGLLLLGPFVQTIVVLVATWHWREPIKNSVGKVASKWHILLLAGVVTFGLANGSFDVTRFASELVLSAWIIAVNVATVVLVVVAIPGSSLQTVRTWFTAIAPEANGRLDRALPWTAAAWVVVITGILAYGVMEGTPHISDGVSHLFQAKYLSAGNLYLPAPPDALAFDFEKFHNDGLKFWAYGFPGWPATLGIGVLLGLPWLVNPVLAGITVLLTHSLVSRLYGRKLAHVVVLLLAVSPWFLFMSTSFMSHTLTVVWTLIALNAVLKVRDGDSVLWGVVGGGALGGLLLTRPFEAVLVGGALGLWILLQNPRQAFKPIVGMAVGGLLIGSLLFVYNNTITGSPLLTPHQVMTDARYYPGADRLGFGEEVGAYGWRHLDPLSGHGPIDVVLNAHMNFYMSNVELLGWAFGSVGFVALLLIWRRVSRQDWLMLLIIGGVIAGHSLFWFSGGPDFGARYWYQILIPLIVLTARGVQEVQKRWVESGGSIAGVSRIGAFVVVASLLAMVTFMPWRTVEKYHNYRGMNSVVADFVDAENFENGLVFVRESTAQDYPRALLLNSPQLDDGDTIFARDLGHESRATLMSYYAGRTAWIVGPAYPDGPYVVIEGPLPTTQSN